MRLLIAAFVVQAALVAGIASQPQAPQPVATESVQVEEAPVLLAQGMPGSNCTGSKPCCEPDEVTGACSLWMICFGGTWVCP